jgi:triacylglycerol esterase/lipase EstA (alpha/beta hydrolase family)
MGGTKAFHRIALAAGAVFTSLMPLPADASAVPDAGPTLSVAQADLQKSLVCPGDVSSVDRDVVILIPGTTLDPRTNFGYSWMRAFEALGFPYCFVVTPDHGMGDIQITSEHVVHAIREVHRRSGRKVDVVGHSQGGTNPRWALRWWPDVRTMIDDYIGLAPSAHGGANVNFMCDDGSCPPAIWQQRYQSNLIRAMNSGGETFPGIDYTVVWTDYDQFLNPPDKPIGGTPTKIDGATNIRLQDICPGNTADHVSIGTHDPVTYAVMMDALTHPGPADPARIDRSVCAQALPPHVDPVAFPANYAKVWAEIFEQLSTYPTVTAEPPLKDYARGG